MTTTDTQRGATGVTAQGETMEGKSVGDKAPLGGVIEIDVRVEILARIPVPATISDPELSQAVLAHVAILAPLYGRVRSLSVQRGGIVGVASLKKM